MKPKPRILLTGGTGLLGRCFLESFGSNYDLFAIVRNRSKVKEIPHSVHPVVADLTKPLSPNELPKGIETIIHLAQSRDYKQFPEKASEIFRVNVNSAMELLDFGRKSGIRQFILASSGSVYKRTENPIQENNPVHCDSYYAYTKLTSENMALQFAPFFQISILRFFFIYGPDQTDRLIPGIIHKVRNGIPIPLEGERGLRLNPLYVSDAAEVLKRTIGNAGVDRLNVGGKDCVDLRTLCDIVGAMLVRPSRYQHGTPSCGDLIADISKMNSLLEFTPRVSLEEGMRLTLDAPSAPLPN